MKRKIWPFWGAALLIAVLGAFSVSAVFALGAIHYTTDVLDAEGKSVGIAHLMLNDGTIKVDLHTTELQPVHVISVWGKINGGSSFHFAGGVSGGDGSLHVAGEVKVVPGVELNEFKVILNDHGGPVPGLTDDQRSSKKDGCAEAGGPNTNCILPVQSATFVID